MKRKLRYPLIVSDFDGTLLKTDDTLADETKRIVGEYIANGGIFVISSGRMTPSILKHARALGLEGLLAAYNGADIVDIRTGNHLLRGYLPFVDALEICREMERLRLHFHVYDGENFYSNHDGEMFSFYEQICQVKGTLVKHQPLSEFVLQNKMNVVKVVAVMSKEERENVYVRLNVAFGNRFDVVRSAKFLVEVCDKRYTKGTALAFIAQAYGIPLEKTLAVGDNQNDLPMLHAAGLGIAVANAEDTLKGQVPVFAYTNDENAVGKIIEEYGYWREEV